MYRSVLLLIILAEPHWCLSQIFIEAAEQYGLADARPASSAAWLDYDNDGDADLLITSSYGEFTALYRNNGAFFKDVADSVGINFGHPTSTRRLSVGDYDNDGDPDLLIGSNSSQKTLYRNDLLTTGTFTGIGLFGSAVFIDYDQDGDLDLYYPVFGGPNRLYRNEGNDRFLEIENALGANNSGHARMAVWGDYDNDGDPDVYVANGRNEGDVLYRNDLRINGRFTDVTESAGITGDEYSEGVCWGDYDNDGDPDLYVINYAQNILYRNDVDTDGKFTDVTGKLGLLSPDKSIHADWADYDNDGFLDLYVVNVEDVPNRLYHNKTVTGNGFVETGEMADTQLGWGGSWGDFDRDGDLDYYLVGGNYGNLAINRLYINSSSNNGHHWLRMQLIGTHSNRSAIGAMVHLYAGDLLMTRHVETSSGQGSQNSLDLEFGLGFASVVDSILVRWPSCIEQRLYNIRSDRFMTITEKPGIFQLEPFDLLWPPHDASLAQRDVTLRWQKANADVPDYSPEIIYKIYHDIDPDWSSPTLVSTTGDTSITLEQLEPGRTYFWRVVASNVAGDSLRSSSEKAFFIQHTAAVAPQSQSPPSAMYLYRNYPNPFNNHTQIVFDLAQPGRVYIDIYSSDGRFIENLLNSDEPAGHHAISWRGRDYQGNPATSGIYLYKIVCRALTGFTFTATGKMCLIR